MTNMNNHITPKPIPVEKALNSILDYFQIGPVRIKGSIYSIFEEELLGILQRRNIKTIDKIGSNHLAMLILNIAKKDKDSIKIIRELCKDIYFMFEYFGFISHENNPALNLDDLFPDKPMEIICEFDF